MMQPFIDFLKKIQFYVELFELFTYVSRYLGPYSNYKNEISYKDTA